MGTEYTILKKAGVEIAIDEMSNRFELAIDADNAEAPASLHSDEGRIGRAHTSAVDMTPEDLITMSLEMLKVASYWCSDEEFRRVTQDWHRSDTSGVLDHVYNAVD